MNEEISEENSLDVSPNDLRRKKRTIMKELSKSLSKRITLMLITVIDLMFKLIKTSDSLLSLINNLKAVILTLDMSHCNSKHSKWLLQLSIDPTKV